MSSKDLTSSHIFEYLEMGVTEGINYVLFKNPVSSTVIDSVKGLVTAISFFFVLFLTSHLNTGCHVTGGFPQFPNPVIRDRVRGGLSANSTLFKGPSAPPSTVKLPPALENLPVSRLVLAGNPFIRLAGLSGAAAVILGAYGAHSFYTKEGYEEEKRIYQTAHTYHFIHSLALFGVPLCRFPKTAGTLLTLGMLLFCGTCYYDAFTGRTEFRKFTPVGGTCLIFGWLCLML